MAMSMTHRRITSSNRLEVGVEGYKRGQGAGGKEGTEGCQRLMRLAGQGGRKDLAY